MTDKCSYCEEITNLEWHHILPRSLGGTDESYNLIRVCSYHHGLIHGLSSRGNIVDLINEGLRKTKEKGTVLGPPLKIHPNTLAEMIEDRKYLTLQEIADKHKCYSSLVGRVLSNWSTRLDDYTTLYNKQQSQRSVTAVPQELPI